MYLYTKVYTFSSSDLLVAVFKLRIRWFRAAAMLFYSP